MASKPRGTSQAASLRPPGPTTRGCNPWGGRAAYSRVVERHGAGRAEGQQAAGPRAPAQDAAHPVRAAEHVRRLQRRGHHVAASGGRGGPACTSAADRKSEPSWGRDRPEDQSPGAWPDRGSAPPWGRGQAWRGGASRRRGPAAKGAWPARGPASPLLSSPRLARGLHPPPSASRAESAVPARSDWRPPETPLPAGPPQARPFISPGRTSLPAGREEARGADRPRLPSHPALSALPEPPPPPEDT